MNDWIALSDQPLSVLAAVEFVTDPASGGIGLFVGTTREESAPVSAPAPTGTAPAEGPERKTLLALDYEAYPRMAADQMQELARAARERWGVRKLVLLHRLGRVRVGEPSVLIAVSTPHRAEAFEACRWLIDTLKRETAIWKKEIWADGSSAWVTPHPARL